MRNVLKIFKASYGGQALDIVTRKTMDELCPLCLKMGTNRRIKAVQINLDEAIWMCENEECPWPFGHQVPNFLPRKVGDKWSDEWEIYKKVQKRIGSIPVSTELSLYTPPVTPIADATTKESSKSDFSNETNISEQINHIGNILSSNPIPHDSYAPKSSSYDKYTLCENDENSKARDAIVKNQASRLSIDSCTIVRTTSVPPSIFDIDGDELSSDKISIKESCDSTRSMNISLAVSELLDVRNSPKIVDTVLKTPGESEISSKILFEARKEEIAVSAVQKDKFTKAKPQIRSIAKANIDLQTMDCRRLVKFEKIDFRKSIKIDREDSLREIEKEDSLRKIDREDSLRKIEKEDSLRKIEKEDSPRKIENVNSLRKIEKDDLPRQIEKEDSPRKIDRANSPKNLKRIDLSEKNEIPLDVESLVSPTKKSSDDTRSPRQCTTTITVDGSIPITLSYDMTDLEEKSEEIKPLASTAIRKKLVRRSLISRSEDERDKTVELSVELPKKQIRIPVKRRVASIGKQYEKFSFSALKKFVRASNDRENDESSGATISPSDERVKFEGIASGNGDEKSFVDRTEKLADEANAELSNQLVGSLSSVNIDSVIPETISDDPVVESLNLSGVLDDILMEGYHNATQNLNDDWLESFFTQDM